jgi:hypothetical protein
VLLAAVEARLLWHTRPGQGPHRAQGIKLAFQMPVLRYAEMWREIDEGRALAFEAWATSVWVSCRAELTDDNCESGVDYWLDVYLARSAVVSVAWLFVQRGPAALMLGGWGLPLLAPPAAGTCLHVLARDGLREVLRGDVVSGCEVIGPPTLLAVRTSLDTANWLETEEISALFSVFPGCLSGVLDRLHSLSLADRSEDFRFGLTCVFLTLGLMGDYAPVDELSRLSGDAAVLDLVQIVNASRYTGEIPEARDTANRLYGGPKTSLLFP